MYSIQNKGLGRYDVLAENGMRAGSILGINGAWSAEIGNEVVGDFSTRDSAAMAVLSSKGIKGIFDQMCAIIESEPDLLIENRHKFYVQDQALIASYKCATDILWIVHQSGTCTIPLDLPISRKDAAKAMYQHNPTTSGKPWKLFLIDCVRLQVEEITEQAAQARLTNSPKYQFAGKKIVSGRLTIATVRMTQPAGYVAADRKCNVKVECDVDPSPQMTAMLSRLAFAAPAEIPGKDVFNQPVRIEVVHKNKVAYLWEHKVA